MNLNKLEKAARIGAEIKHLTNMVTAVGEVMEVSRDSNVGISIKNRGFGVDGKVSGVDLQAVLSARIKTLHHQLQDEFGITLEGIAPPDDELTRLRDFVDGLRRHLSTAVDTDLAKLFDKHGIER